MPHTKTRELAPAIAALAALADALGTSPGQLATELAACTQQPHRLEKEPPLADLIAQAQRQDASLRKHRTYLRVLCEGVPAYQPLDGPPEPALPGLASPSAVTTTALQDLQRARARYAATQAVQEAKEHNRPLPA